MTYTHRFKIICTFLYIAACATAAAEREQVQPLYLYSGAALSARPLSAEWLDYVGKSYFNGPGGGAVNELLAELVAAEPAAVSEWSERTQSELNGAISEDGLLRNNSWSAVRCSAHGCVAAIDSLDAVVRSPRPTGQIQTLKDRMRAYMTPQPGLPTGKDCLVFETHGGESEASSHWYILFFVFPNSSKVDGQSVSPHTEAAITQSSN